MNISQLIEALELAKNRFGDLPVAFYDYAANSFFIIDKVVDTNGRGISLIEVDSTDRRMIQ
jgi:hypothetical protein